MLNIMKTILLLTTISSGLSAQQQTRALIADDYPSTIENAQGIMFNEFINGDIETSGDEDWFKITILTPDGVTIDVEANNGTVGTKDFIKLKLYSYNPPGVYPELNTLVDIYSASAPGTATLNLSQGTYYIQVYNLDDSLSGYTFKVTSSENSGSWTPDIQTIEYCKEHLEECGIKAKVIPIIL